jgi:hypothetical protein
MTWSFAHCSVGWDAHEQNVVNCGMELTLISHVCILVHSNDKLYNDHCLGKLLVKSLLAQTESLHTVLDLPIILD